MIRKDRRERQHAAHLRYVRALALERTIRGCRPVALSSIERGAVVEAIIPFADGTGWKRRPAIVVDRLGTEVTLVPCFTRRRELPWDCELEPRLQAQFSRPTVLRPRKTVTVDRIDVIALRAGPAT